MSFNDSRKSVFLIPLGISIVSLLVFVLAITLNWMGESGMHGMKFCESGYPGLIKQPVNTFSNIGFIIVGLGMAYSQSKRHFAQNNNLFTRTNFFPTFFASLIVVLGPGSMALHATTTKVGGFLDLFSMYLAASFTFSYAISRLLKWKSLGFSLMFIIALGIHIYVHFLPYEIPFVGVIGSFCFGVFIILSAIIELTSHRIRKVQIEAKFGYACVLTMIIATFIWGKSLTGAPWCDPSSLIQGHGIWHLLNALSVYFLYRFYVSENFISKKVNA